MTTIYVPRLIESAEQAEALPIGTVALDHPTGNAGRLPYMKATAARWASVWGVDDLGAIDAYGTAPNEAMVGDRALVPIEAEEEWALVLDDDGSMDVAESEAEVREWVRLGDEPRPPVHRLVTPWEEAQ